MAIVEMMARSQSFRILQTHTYFILVFMSVATVQIAHPMCKLSKKQSCYLMKH